VKRLVLALVLLAPAAALADASKERPRAERKAAPDDARLFAADKDAPSTSKFAAPAPPAAKQK